MVLTVDTITSNDCITLDIGGIIFKTSKQTLRRLPNFFTNEQDDGSFFVDRDGSNFHYVLDYLHTGTLPDFGTLDEYTLRHLLRELRYYCLAMSEAVKPTVHKKLPSRREAEPVPLPGRYIHTPEPVERSTTKRLHKNSRVKQHRISTSTTTKISSYRLHGSRVLIAYVIENCNIPTTIKFAHFREYLRMRRIKERAICTRKKFGKQYEQDNVSRVRRMVKVFGTVSSLFETGIIEQIDEQGHFSSSGFTNLTKYLILYYNRSGLIPLDMSPVHDSADMSPVHDSADVLLDMHNACLLLSVSSAR